MKDYAEGCGIYVERWKGEMVERFPRNKSHPTPKQVHQVIFCVIPGKRTLDPGSSLFKRNIHKLHKLTRIKRTLKSQHARLRNKTLQTKNRVITACRGPRQSAWRFGGVE